jgi:hypothetical protein
MIPMKKTNVTPKEMPAIRIFPNANPMADIKDTTITACIAECSENRLYNQFIILFAFRQELAKIETKSLLLYRNTV